ncbi:MAG: DUF1028 domain-containing protein [Phycisphaerales bacterium]|nr:DUF1028 domain-containing protein [Phycisphaerales bacterium]
MARCNRSIGIILIVVAYVVAGAEATWSIVAVDQATCEVGVASATCLTSFDLRVGLPMVLPEVGVAAAQSRIDSNATNRRRIRDMMLAGEDPVDILAALAANDGPHEQRQYGMVDLSGRALTFSGTQTGAYAGGVTGCAGSIVYAIQGNVITGAAVITAAEVALRDTPGALPERLMAAMEAARAMGGDGRCSGSSTAPDSCGAPPPSFVRSAYVGFLIVGRPGDTVGVCNRRLGCANGDYYLNLNVTADLFTAPDPVPLLREMFDEWRAGLAGATDIAESLLTVSRSRILASDPNPVVVHLTLRDWQGLAPAGVESIQAAHADDSLGSSTIGEFVNLAADEFEVPILAGAAAGRDRIVVTVAHADGRVVTFPTIELRVQDPRADLNGDGVVDLLDLGILLGAFGSAATGDVTADGVTDLADLAALLPSL